MAINVQCVDLAVYTTIMVNTSLKCYTGLLHTTLHHEFHYTFEIKILRVWPSLHQTELRTSSVWKKLDTGCDQLQLDCAAMPHTLVQ